MLLECSNSGCHKSGDHKLNKKTNEVICEFCGQPIKNISQIMKNTLSQLGQVIREHTKKFVGACLNCKAEREVILESINNKVVCKACGNEVKVPAPIKQALIELKKINENG